MYKYESKINCGEIWKGKLSNEKIWDPKKS